jgi:hypothetical protein
MPYGLDNKMAIRVQKGPLPPFPNPRKPRGFGFKKGGKPFNWSGNVG